MSLASEDPSDPQGPRFVLAASAGRHDIRRLARRDRLASSLWPVPALFGAAALLAALITVALDDSFDFHAANSRFLVGDTGTALTLTSVVATGMLAFLGIVFATTLVAIQLAASQYSPRAVRVFVRSRLTKVALGIFIATFVYSIVTLIAIRSTQGRNRGFTPVISTTGVALLVVATLVAFLLFANGTARLLRVQYLVERIANETRPALAAGFPQGGEVAAVLRPTPAPAPLIIGARTHGVIDAVDVRGLATLAAEASGWVEVTRPIGSLRREPVPPLRGCTPASASPVDTDGFVCEQFLLTNERSLLLDPGFGLRQLVDIAIRALSPAVNDPTTAVQVIDRVVDLLGTVIERPDPTGWYMDDAGTARVRLPVDTFDELATLGFAEIIRYGADSPQVARRLRAAFDDLASRGPRPGIVALQQLLDAATNDAMPSAFAALATSPDPRGLG